MPHTDAPPRRQLHAAGERSLLAAALFGAAALVASRGGYAGQVWPYVVMAVAVLPQALLALVARVDSEHRVDIRVSRRPIWPNAIVGIVLAGAALVAGVRGGAGSAAAWSAALGAVAGLLAAVPPVLVQPRVARRSRDGGTPRTPGVSVPARSGSPAG